MMTYPQDRLLRFAFFMLGVALPLAGILFFNRNTGSRKSEVDKAHDITVEDSFPASDPPSAW